MDELTEDFSDIVKDLMAEDPEFRHGLLQDVLECFLEGDFRTGQGMLRDYFLDDLDMAELARATKIPAKQLNGMCDSGKWDPSAKNLFGVVAYLSKRENIKLKVVAE